MGIRYVPHPPGQGYHPGKPIIAPVCYGSGQETPGIAVSVQDIHEIGPCVAVVISYLDVNGPEDRVREATIRGASARYAAAIAATGKAFA